jgi:hypothetical protein
MDHNRILYSSVAVEFNPSANNVFGCPSGLRRVQAQEGKREKEEEVTIAIGMRHRELSEREK